MALASAKVAKTEFDAQIRSRRDAMSTLVPVPGPWRRAYEVGSKEIYTCPKGGTSSTCSMTSWRLPPTGSRG
jgi:hypothetical protein